MGREGKLRTAGFGSPETLPFPASLAHMAARDPHTCRRALRDIGEIAAVAVLPDSQLTDQEALQNISAIAEWGRGEAPRSGADCGDVIRRLHDMTAGIEFDALDDRQALNLFGEVLGVLETADTAVFGD